MPPLPASVPTKFNRRPNYASIKSAYDRCLLAEHYYTDRLESDTDARLALICVRILGYLIHHVPSEVGLATIVRQIHSCNDDAALREAGHRYLSALTWAFKAGKGRTPPPSNDTSPLSFDTLADMINDTVETTPQSHASAKRSALSRDGFRCMVTRKYDWRSAKNNLELRALHLEFDNMSSTRCAHIFSESINSDEDRREQASTTWAVMSGFGYPTLPHDLNGANVHRLENIMTLDAMIHEMFNSLEIWFIPTDLEHWEDRKHIYRVEVTPANEWLSEMYSTVTFTSTRDDLPLPSPEYLAIYATCAKVAHLSGASQWFEEYDGDLDEHIHESLANDGSSAHLLHNALYLYALTGEKQLRPL